MGLLPGSGSARPLRFLLAEDSENAAVNLVSVLQHAGYRTACERIFNAETLATVLNDRPWDVIVCGRTVPRFDIPIALAVVRGRGLATPVIAVAHWRDEAQRRAWMRAGVSACVRPGQSAELADAVAEALGVRRRHHAGVSA